VVKKAGFKELRLAAQIHVEIVRISTEPDTNLRNYSRYKMIID
jgi:hypothetical protein